MKTQAFLLSAAALVLAASPTWAAPSELDRYADRAKAQAERLLHATPLDLKGQSVSVRAKFDVDGRVTGLQVVRSSGSHDVDLAAETVLKKVVARDAPLGLTDGAVLMTVGATPIVQASAQ
ncbi:MAG TPA: TonB C-terminal domain-containing protein [Caulobacteraceae bacterium]|nr:TonB C-terminal domain-containing protein [Caulobacteraceae bacterium]